MQWTSAGAIDATADATWKWMQRFMAPNDASTFNFAIVERRLEPDAQASDGSSPRACSDVVGVVGYMGGGPPPAFEIGYMLREEVWGLGYATEALGAWMRAWWGLERRRRGKGGVEHGREIEEGGGGVDREKLVAVVQAENRASRRVLERCGFEEIGERMERSKDEDVLCVIYEVARPDEKSGRKGE